MQSPCGPGAYTLPEKETRKRTKQFNSKNTASSSKQYDLLEYQVFFSKNQPTKKTKIGGGETGEARDDVPLFLVYVSHSRTLWTTTNKLEAGPAAKGRDNEGQMRRSHVCFFGLVATCDVPGTCPTRKLPLFFKPDPDGTTTKQISYFGDPQTAVVSY